MRRNQGSRALVVALALLLVGCGTSEGTSQAVPTATSRPTTIKATSRIDPDGTEVPVDDDVLAGLAALMEERVDSL